MLIGIFVVHIQIKMSNMFMTPIHTYIWDNIIFWKYVRTAHIYVPCSSCAMIDLTLYDDDVGRWCTPCTHLPTDALRAGYYYCIYIYTSARR